MKTYTPDFETRYDNSFPSWGFKIHKDNGYGIEWLYSVNEKLGD